MIAKAERLATLVESHAQGFKLEVPISALWWEHALSTTLFLVRFGFGLGRIHWGLERIYHDTQRRMSAGTLPREELLGLIDLYGDSAARLFRLAENEEAIVGKFSELLNRQDSAALRLSRWCYRKMAHYHELAGCAAEDNAETLALSASEPFADLVRRELDGQT